MEATLNPETLTQYSRAELLTAFGIVENKQNWKMAIDASVPAKVAHLEDRIREAVIFFTGSVPTITKNADGSLKVKAAGYYRTIGA